MREKLLKNVEKVLNVFAFNFGYLIAIMVIVFLEVCFIAEIIDGTYNIPTWILLVMLVTCNGITGAIMHEMVTETKEILRG